MTSSLLSVGFLLAVVTVLRSDLTLATGSGGIDDRSAATSGADGSRDAEREAGTNQRSLSDGGGGTGKGRYFLNTSGHQKSIIREC